MFRRSAIGLFAAGLALAHAACSSPATTTTTPAPAAPPASLDALAQRSLARLDGELKVPGLKAPVEIVRDQQGIPHIYAQNDDDLFFAQGYVMAQDRLWQLEMWRRWREGRLAEVFGAKAYDLDARARLMKFRGPWDETEWTSYHPDAERLFTAWANGLNAYVAQQRENLPVEFALTGITPEPWTARTLTLRWSQVGLDSASGTPADELRLALDVATMGVKAANAKAAPDPWDDLVVPEGLDVKSIPAAILEVIRRGDRNPFDPGVLPPPEIVAQFRDLVAPRTLAHLMPELQDMDGSNNWVVSGKLTTTGVPIVANDPHRTIEMPSLRYFVHLVSPGWNVIGGAEPPFVGVDAGSNDKMAWAFTFAGIDMVDTVVEETHPADANQTKFNGEWAPMNVIREEIKVKGEASRFVDLKYTRHGPVFFEDPAHHRAYVAQSVNQQPGTAPFKGSLRLAQAQSCDDFFDRAMSWKVPTHNLLCGDTKGNIALQVSGLTPDRKGWNGRLPVPGTGKYEWQGFRSDLPREFNPERGYIATANDNTHPPGYKGRPVLYRTSAGVEVSRITRIHQMLGTGQKFSVADLARMQHDAYSLRAERDLPLFQGWTSANADVEKARLAIDEWDHVLSADSRAAAIYVRWTATEAAQALAGGASLKPRDASSRTLVETGLQQAIGRLTKDWGADWNQWRYGRINTSELPHMFVPQFGLPPMERPGGFNTVNATGANFRRIIDLSNVDNSVATNAPGQSAQPGSPYYGNNRERLANGQYFPLPYTRPAVDKSAAHKLTLMP